MMSSRYLSLLLLPVLCVAANAQVATEPVILGPRLIALAECIWATYPEDAQAVSRWNLEQGSKPPLASLKHKLCTSKPEFSGRLNPDALVAAITIVRRRNLVKCIVRRDLAGVRMLMARMPSVRDQRVDYFRKHPFSGSLRKTGLACDAFLFSQYAATTTDSAHMADLIEESLPDA